MTNARAVCLFLLGLLAVAVAGCRKKEVKLVFNNMTTTTRTVEVSQGIPPTFYPIGPVPPQGKLRYRLEIEEKYLPLPCASRAGNQGQDFTVTRQTDPILWCDIDPSGTPVMRDAHTERTVERTKVETKIIKKNVPVIE